MNYDDYWIEETTGTIIRIYGVNGDYKTLDVLEDDRFIQDVVSFMLLRNHSRINFEDNLHNAQPNALFRGTNFFGAHEHIYIVDVDTFVHHQDDQYRVVDGLKNKA